MILQGITNLLLANPGVATLIGARVSPVELPQDSALPAVVYRTISSVAKQTLDTAGMTRLRLEVDCWGSKFGDADATRYAVIKALEQYSGVLSDGTFLQDVQTIQQMDFFEHDLLLYGCMVEFYLFFNLQ
jgi:hypothetical protein